MPHSDATHISWIARFSVGHPVLVNLLMVGLFLFGWLALARMPQELNPRVDFNWVFINTVYPGAAPSEVEALIVDKIEAEIHDVDDIDVIQSTSSEGFAFILVKFKDISDTAFRERYTELKTEVEKVDLPEDALDPVLDAFDSGDFLPVITVNMAYAIPDANA